MKTVIESIFGVYMPIVDGEGVALIGVAGVDWSYIAGVVLFAITLLCFFKLVGVVLKK
jgi:hypothetical protein